MLSDVGPIVSGTFEIIFKGDLKQYSIWLYIHTAIQLINNLAIKWIGDPINEKVQHDSH